MINNGFLEKLLYNLETLDANDWTKIVYDDINFTIKFVQKGRIVNARSLQGLVKMKQKLAILSPEDLILLKKDIEFCIQYTDVLLFAPMNLGFKVYGRDLNIYEPVQLIELKFYSIKNRMLLKLAKLFNKRMRILLR